MNSSDLLEFPRPSLAVDVAVLSVVEERLSVLLLRRATNTHAGAWSLPGSFVRERERLADAVERTLLDKCGVRGLSPRQLRVLDDPDRDDRGWVLSVAHVDTVAVDRAAELVAKTDVAWAPIESMTAGRPRPRLPDGQVRLPFDHDDIVGHAVDDLRARYAERPDPAGLLTEPFTVLELRRVHEAVAGAPLNKDTFRRAMIPFLEATPTLESGTVGRPARRYRRR